MIVGRTGSGKTRAGIWHLSRRDLSDPWILFDFKRDDLIARLPATEIKLTDKLPKEGGLYVVRPNPSEDDEALVEIMLMRCWARGNIGLYFDEGFMVPDEKALRMILTQGRSLKIPVIMLSQRPVWLSRFAFSEADFFQLFDLNDQRDRKTIGSFMPTKAQERLKPFHSWFYDVGKNELAVMLPVPSDDEIIASFPDQRKKGFFFA